MSAETADKLGNEVVTIIQCPTVGSTPTPHPIKTVAKPLIQPTAVSSIEANKDTPKTQSVGEIVAKAMVQHSVGTGNGVGGNKNTSKQEIDTKIVNKPKSTDSDMKNIKNTPPTRN